MAGDVRPPFGCMAITIAAMPPADPQPPHTTRYFSRRSNAEAKAVFPRFTQRYSGANMYRTATFRYHDQYQPNRTARTRVGRAPVLYGKVCWYGWFVRYDAPPRMGGHQRMPTEVRAVHRRHRGP